MKAATTPATLRSGYTMFHPDPRAAEVCLAPGLQADLIGLESRKYPNVAFQSSHCLSVVCAVFDFDHVCQICSLDAQSRSFPHSLVSFSPWL